MFKKTITSKSPEIESHNPETLNATFSGSPISPLMKGSPKRTQSLCPECLAVIPALEYEQDKKVLMTKECHEHGVFNDIISSDVRIFSEMEKWHSQDFLTCSMH